MTQTAFAEQEAAAARKALPLPQRREAARRMYRESVTAGMPMTATALGEAFGLSARWGRDRVAEARADLAKLAKPAASADRTAEPEPEPESASTSSEVVPEVDEPAPPASIEPTTVEATSAAVVDVPSRVRAWPVLLLALPAFVAIWSGWVGLGGLTGFGEVHPLPGILDGAKLNTAITLPIGVETYAAYALRVWLSGAVPIRARRFARRSAIGALMLGAGGQVAYHLMAAAHVTAAPWWITTLVAALPVAVLGMGAALAHLIRDGRSEVIR